MLLNVGLQAKSSHLIGNQTRADIIVTKVAESSVARPKSPRLYTLCRPIGKLCAEFKYEYMTQILNRK